MPPVDARVALLSGLFDHAPTFPPASLPPREAIAEDRRARASRDSWILGRLVWAAARLDELPADEDRALAVVDGPSERHGDTVYLESVPLDEVAAQGARAKVRCGGAGVPTIEELAAFVRGCRDRGVVFKATAGLHHAYPTGEGEHGFLNLLAAAVFGDEEEALAARRGSVELDETSFRWSGREAGPEQLAEARRDLLSSIGSCSFFEPVAELRALGMLP
jgi:hypothetical protein